MLAVEPKQRVHSTYGPWKTALVDHMCGACPFKVYSFDLMVPMVEDVQNNNLDGIN